MPFTTLCPTFLAVFAVLFATFFAVLAGPASTTPMEMAKARMIEKNAFMVLNDSFLMAGLRPSGWQPLLFRYAPKRRLGPPGFEPGTKGL